MFALRIVLILWLDLALTPRARADDGVIIDPYFRSGIVAIQGALERRDLPGLKYEWLLYTLFNKSTGVPITYVRVACLFLEQTSLFDSVSTLGNQPLSITTEFAAKNDHPWVDGALFQIAAPADTLLKNRSGYRIFLINPDADVIEASVSAAQIKEQLAAIDSVMAGLPPKAKNGSDLGITFIPDSLPMPGGAGLIITQVAAGSPAASAGLQVGDIIETVGDLAVNNSHDLERSLDASEGSQVAVVTLRHMTQETTLSIPVRSEWRPPDGAYTKIDPDDPNASSDLGIRFVPFSVLDSSAVGAIVTEAQSGGPGDKAGVRAGDIILTITRSAVKGDIHQALEKLRGVRAAVMVVLRGRTVLKMNVRFDGGHGDRTPPR
jgi:hypothetical protein